MFNHGDIRFFVLLSTYFSTLVIDHDTLILGEIWENKIVFMGTPINTINNRYKYTIHLISMRVIINI
jgi:hypothetical protein